MRAFAQSDRFVSEVEARKLQPAYVFVGDETFFRNRCREAILKHLVPADLRDFSLFDFDLSETDLAEVLDRARTPSLMAPFQVFFVRGVKTLFGRGSNDEKLAAIEAYCKDPNPDAVLIFVADHIGIPADARRMDMTDKERYERIRQTMGGFCAIVELARVEESEAVRWIGEYCAMQAVKIDADAARELVDALGGNMMMVSNELEKLILYVGAKKRITLGDVETMVLAAKQRSLYELTDAISSKDRVRALQMLDAILNTGDGDEAAIGHLYMLAKTFRQMLVILERNVRDQRMLWAALWQGFRVPPFAADDIIRQARRYKSKRELTRAIRLVAKTDLALRSNPPSKRFVLEKLILDLTAEAKPEIPGWSQEELPV
jgi:DNA polymerase-3 subunit delta